VRTNTAPKEIRSAAPSVGARERLLLAAAQVFRESGYRSASLDEILKRSQVAKSNFYYHFKSKLDLAVAVLDLWSAMVGPRLHGSLASGAGNGMERVRTFVGEFQSVCTEGSMGCPFGMLAAEADLEPALRERVQGMLERMESSLSKCLLEGQDDGSIRPDLDAHDAARGLLATVQGGGLIARALGDKDRISGAARPMLALMRKPT